MFNKLHSTKTNTITTHSTSLYQRSGLYNSRTTMPLLIFSTTANYRAEKHSVQAFLQSLEQAPIISNLTKTEFASTLSRWVRTKELSTDEADQIQVLFSQHLEQKLYQVRTINDSDFILADSTYGRVTDA